MDPRTNKTLAALFFITALACVRLHAATYEVGPTQTYTSVNALLSSVTLASGDEVDIDSGTYTEVVRWQQSGVTVRGIGSSRPVFDATGLNVNGSLPNPRAIFQIEASDIIIDNVEFIHAANGNNGSGVRVTNFSSSITNNAIIRNCKITYCDMGMQSDSCDNLLVESCEVAFNGTSSYSGFSHNFYLNGNKSTIRFCYIHDSLYGQNFKTRGHYTELLYNTISDSQDGEIGLVDSAGLTDTANSNAVMIGNIVTAKVRGSAWNHTRFIQFGQDGGNAHTGTLYAINNTFYTADNRINFVDVNATGAGAVFQNNIFYGSDTLLQSGSNPISGTTNWMQNTASVPAGVTGSVMSSSPGLTDLSSRDYHLVAGSVCIDAGTASPTYADGTGATQSGVPAFEYVNDLSSIARPSVGSLDIGAYEYAPNQAPAFQSTPTYSPNPASAGQSLSFTTAASDPDGDSLTYTWAFGDGGTGSTATPTYTYVAAGTYTVQVTATDAGGLSATSSVTVIVNAPSGTGGPGGGTGSGGTGGTSGSGSNGSTSGNTAALTVTHLQCNVSFSRSGHDRAVIQGKLPGVPALFDPAGQALTLNLDGVTVAFTLSATGHGKSSQGSATLKFKPAKRNKTTRKIEFQGGDVAFSIQLHNGTWASVWNLDPNATGPITVSMPVTIQLGGTTYQAIVPAKGTSKPKSGANIKI